MSNEYSVCLVMDASNNYKVEADSPDEAAQKAEEMQWQKGVSLCHQCSREVELGDVIGAIVFQDDQEVLDTTHNAQRVADLEKERDALRAELAITRRVVDRIGQLCTTPHESKERFIRRVQSVIEWQTAAQQDQPK